MNEVRSGFELDLIGCRLARALIRVGENDFRAKSFYVCDFKGESVVGHDDSCVNPFGLGRPCERRSVIA